jgi:hypothetical protein
MKDEAGAQLGLEMKSMRVRQELGQQVTNAILAAQATGDLPDFDLPPGVIEKPREADHGDDSSPVAIVLDRHARAYGPSQDSRDYQ